MNNPIKVPSGVELRGSWDVQHHTQSGGTAIFTNYDGGNAGESGPSLIQLEAHAGIRGITLAQLNIASDGFSVEPEKDPVPDTGTRSEGVYYKRNHSCR